MRLCVILLVLLTASPAFAKNERSAEGSASDEAIVAGFVIRIEQALNPPQSNGEGFYGSR
jgi:hypothetical protein